MTSGNTQVAGHVEVWRGERVGTGVDRPDVPNATSSVVVDGHPAVLTEERYGWGPNRWVTWHPAPGLTAEQGKPLAD